MTKHAIQPNILVFREHLHVLDIQSFIQIYSPFYEDSSKNPPPLFYQLPIRILIQKKYIKCLRKSNRNYPQLLKGCFSQYRTYQLIYYNIFLLQVTAMKQTNMRAPAITQLYQQKLLYQTHLKKLQKIREDRKNQLALDSHRISRQKDMKVSKSRSFAYRFNQQCSGIMQQNKRFLKKLEKIKPSSRYTSFSTFERQEKQQGNLTPFRKQRMVETEKENNRIYVRVKSVSSELSKDKMLKDYAKSMQIRSRITKYVNSNNRICLKSQRTLSLSQDKQNLVHHYNAKDILKNQVEKPKTSLARQRRQALTSREEKNNFFATEPKNNKKIRKTPF